MRFEIIGKTRSTLVDIDIQSQKRGQTDVVPAVALTFKIALANNALNMLDKGLLQFLYSKGSAGGAKQSTLEGVDAVSDMPELTTAAVMLGDLNLKEDAEQTGCKLVIHQGASGRANITLVDGTTTVKKISPKEGGAVEFTVVFYTASDIDAETLGDLGVLKSHDLDIELTAPALISAQKSISEPDVSKVTSIKGKASKLGTDADQAKRQAEVLAEHDGKNSRQTPAQALAAVLGVH